MTPQMIGEGGLTVGAMAQAPSIWRSNPLRFNGWMASMALMLCEVECLRPRVGEMREKHTRKHASAHAHTPSLPLPAPPPLSLSF